MKKEKNYVITKKELCYTIHKKTGQMEERAMMFIDAFMSIVNEELANGNDISLRGFGTFGTRLMKKRRARNINTGEVVIIPAHYKPFFKPYPDMINKCFDREVEEVKQE